MGKTRQRTHPGRSGPCLVATPHGLVAERRRGRVVWVVRLQASDVGKKVEKPRKWIKIDNAWWAEVPQTPDRPPRGASRRASMGQTRCTEYARSARKRTSNKYNKTVNDRRAHRANTSFQRVLVSLYAKSVGENGPSSNPFGSNY